MPTHAAGLDHLSGRPAGCCDTDEIWLNARPFDPGWPRSMTIDTSDLPAQQTAEQILDRIRMLEANYSQ
jgi:hypothetical protein